jgi:transposase-like protein
VAATKAELFERIRRDSWREGLSIRALARRYGVHQRLVREALTHAEPAPRKTPGKPLVRADRGNHFVAWQEPTLFTTEVRAAFRSLR